jgi:hypothetical protein
MSAALDQLLEAFERQPDEATALSLCEELEQTRHRELIDEMGKRLATTYASNPTMLLAVARMYLRVRRLGDAQGLLVAAGRIAPKNADVYRWLGEVLLRRGDASRAVKVLERATSLGRRDDETSFWRRQAEAHVHLQNSDGAQAVVVALAKVLPPLSRSSRPPPASSGPPPLPPSERLRAPAVSASPSSSRRPALPPPLPPPQSKNSVPPPAQSRAPKATAPSSASRPPTSNGHALPSFDLSAGPPPRTALAEANRVLGKRPSTRPPPPRALLQVFADTGVFEPSGPTAATWAAAPRTRVRFSFSLLVLTVLLLGAGTGIFMYVRDKRSKQAVQARELDAEVQTLLQAGKIADLPHVNDALSRAFDLEPNNPTTALLWTRDLVLRSLEMGAEEQGIDSAINRAREAGVAEADLAFARVGSFLAQNDTAGAIALLPQWDAVEKREPYFQILAGAALERAGDLRAIERFELATKLEPSLAAGHILLARAVVLEGTDRGRNGGELVRAVQARWPGRAEGAALLALSWVRDPGRDAAPPEVEQARSRKDELPVSLRAVPSAIEALQAVQKGASAEARSAIERGLSMADTPGVATWLGSLALSLNEDGLARRAALRAVSFSAVYPPARILAARVALAQGRIDEAMTAVSDLDPASVDVAVVRAAAAYERFDAGGLDLALDALSAEWKARPELAALTRAGEVLRGVRSFDAKQVRAMIAPDAAWSELIALDAALDSGNLPLAKELIDKFGEAKDRPPRALRIARYLRYVEKPAEADAPSATALGLVSPRSLIERVLVLLATSHADDARALVAKQALVLGPMASWVSAYIDAEGPRSADARARAALLDPAPPSAPLGYRVVTALALADLGDRRRGAVAARALAKDFPRNPDVALALKTLRR